MARDGRAARRPFAEQRPRSARSASGFSPRVDVYYCGDDEPQAIVKADLAGVDVDAVALEVSGRELVISGERAGRRRPRAASTSRSRSRPARSGGWSSSAPTSTPSAPGPPTRTGSCGSSCRSPARSTRRVPIERSRGEPERVGAAATRLAGRRDRRPRRGDPRARRTSRCRRRCRCCRCARWSPIPDTLTPLAVGQERSIKLVDDVLSGERTLVMVASSDPELDEPGPDDAPRRRRRRRRRADAQGARRHDPDPRPGDASGSGIGDFVAEQPYLVARIERAARRGRAVARARGADPQRPAHLQRDHRADPVPARGAPARGHQRRRSLGALAPDRRRAADLDRGEAGAARGGRRRPGACAGSRRSSPASSR